MKNKMKFIWAIGGLIIFGLSVFTKGVFSTQAIYGLLCLLVAWILDVEEKINMGQLK